MPHLCKANPYLFLQAILSDILNSFLYLRSPYYHKIHFKYNFLVTAIKDCLYYTVYTTGVNFLHVQLLYQTVVLLRSRITVNLSILLDSVLRLELGKWWRS